MYAISNRGQLLSLSFSKYPFQKIFLTVFDKKIKVVQIPLETQIFEFQSHRRIFGKITQDVTQNEGASPSLPLIQKIATSVSLASESVGMSSVAAPAHPPSTILAAETGQEYAKVEQRNSKSQLMDTSNDEGPTYDGTGGLGLAKGTRNTYIIPGMDEMSPEEYRAALQKSVSDRQSIRKERRSGVVGNRAALQYLDQLGYGGASSNWAKKENE